MLFFLLCAVAFGNPVQFSDWSKEHGKVYGTTAETLSRYEIFKSNVAWINKRNTELKHMTVGLNEFADMTQEEFEKIYLLQDFNSSEYTAEVMANTVEQDPNNIHVGGQCATAVRNQGQCGSCWAFSAGCALEALLCIAGEEENAYGWVSTQELVDCTCSGCNGGWPKTALAYYKSAGICYESEYKYTARKGSCGSSKCKHSGGAIGSVARCQDVGGGITSALGGNFVSICIDAGGLDFRFYSSGIYGLDKQENAPGVNCNKHSVNHAVTAVGNSLNEDGSGNYRVKNSWGASWGSSGYFTMPAGVNCLAVNANPSVYPTK